MSFFERLSDKLDITNNHEKIDEKAGVEYKGSKAIIGKIFFCTMILFVLPLVSWYLFSHKPIPAFYTIKKDTESKQIITERLNTLNVPSLSNKKIEKWTERALKESFSFDFYNYQARINESAGYFTDDGWVKFQEALSRAKILDTVKASSLEVWLTPTAPAFITKINNIDGRAVWVLEMPAVITYTGPITPVNQKVIVKTTLVQVSTADNPYGVQIAQVSINN